MLKQNVYIGAINMNWIKKLFKPKYELPKETFKQIREEEKRIYAQLIGGYLILTDTDDGEQVRLSPREVQELLKFIQGEEDET